VPQGLHDGIETSSKLQVPAASAARAERKHTATAESSLVIGLGSTAAGS
jgi:hypothetical protein